MDGRSRWHRLEQRKSTRSLIAALATEKRRLRFVTGFYTKKKFNYDLQKNNLTEKVCQLHNYIPYKGASYNTFFHGLFKYFFECMQK